MNQLKYIVKQILFIFLFVLFSEETSAQMMITTEAPEIGGLCNNMKVYALFNNMKGHTEPECRLNKEEIEKLTI